MADIYISGHRNPDMDSVCAAYSYAYLKNKLDPTNTYIPVRCGNLNETTKAQFERIAVTPPAFIKDVRSRVSSVTRTPKTVLQTTDPVYNLVSFYGKATQSSVIPILEGAEYRGLLSVDEVSSFVLLENNGTRPIYHFVPDNFPKVLRGKFLRKGELDSFDAPIMVGAMRYTVFCKHMEALVDQKPILVVGDREDHIRKAVEMQIPAIVLTGLEHGLTSQVDFSSYKGTVFVSEGDTAETLRLLRLTIPVTQLISTNPPKIQDDTLFDEAKAILAESEFRGLPVFSGETWKGFITRRCFLERPRTKLIMVDHNEPEQSVPGIEEAEVVEIIDHHRLGAAKTRQPIYIRCEPLGSTCTIIYNLFTRSNVAIPESLAKVMLSGIVSDTIMLKSPTTTFEDFTAVQDLCALANIPDMVRFGERMFSSGASLAKEDPRKMLEADFKQYEEFGVRFGIGQCEVTTLSDLEDYREAYLKELEQLKRAYGLSWAMFLITDVVREHSVLLMTPMQGFERKLVYIKQADETFSLPKVLSRKKQLLPEILRVLGE
ncbi:putative manganese-dependent inorganic diphosphatase [Sphaerochaeta sp. PS]|uniref:putative manganese-dependent inorganic diphosphatase n=1 Tax=Sphaerochaeta sp. PS TaxID=3076336 RepID=UPI0028A54D16|nr:putative manganese-dependent inorganic diphosphatase [Sphaerochaeta sp. PS]MDT4761387.1 putative manganese-dependent inorganic diphosphatase [Sphaerochaeta sp. PS]